MYRIMKKDDSGKKNLFHLHPKNVWNFGTSFKNGHKISE